MITMTFLDPYHPWLDDHDGMKLDHYFDVGLVRMFDLVFVGIHALVFDLFVPILVLDKI